MEWVLANPQIHSTFGSLGYVDGDDYCVNDDCLSTLEDIFNKLLGEDKNLRTFRRAVGFGQNIKKDLIPILIHVKENTKVTEMTIKILVNLTIPIECLLSVDNISKNDVGQHTIFELNNLLLSSKEAFLDNRATKAIVDYMKLLSDDIKSLPLNIDNINNCLLLLRNILHIPDSPQETGTATHSSSQNQILWNLFSQNMDRTLVGLITSPYGNYWSVTMAQLIALIYKDQHVNTLQKLLNQWLETSLSESSEDNESNTSPPDQGSDDSSPVVTSDPTSDSSDTGGINHDTQVRSSNQNNSKQQDVVMENATSSKGLTCGGNKHQMNNQTSKQSNDCQEKSFQKSNTTQPQQNPDLKATNSQNSGGAKKECPSGNSEFSDCGYVTQIENQESISTSSNEDEIPQQKPVHQKPRTNVKPRPIIIPIQGKKEKRKKKLVKRGKSNLINMKGLVHHTPTDEDIANVIKEFTVEFLGKGYGTLIKQLHSQLLINVHLQIDTSHFFWLVTYFLKFASQVELELEYIQQVLSFEILSYLTFEGVNLCEQIQLKIHKKNLDLKPLLRRMHLLVTAIREFIQTINNYENVANVTNEDRVYLTNLQLRISFSSDLRCLMVLLLRHYQQNVHTKQYLQDVIITNHILLLFLDNASKHQNNSFCDIMLDHLRQFTTTETMHPYGLLLETFNSNGEYVNDCIFTMMHHVAGDLQSINTLFQPHILRVFSQIWETDFELCDDWTDLVEYVINTFIKTPRPVAPAIIFSEREIPFEGNCAIAIAAPLPTIIKTDSCSEPSTSGESKWSQEDIDNLHWFYMQSQNRSNYIGAIHDMFEESGINKSEKAIITEMFKEEIIVEDEFNKLIARFEDYPGNSSGVKITELTSKASMDYNMELEKVDKGVTKMKLETIAEENKPSEKEDEDVEMDLVLNHEIKALINSIQEQNMGEILFWLQKTLLELCHAKHLLDTKTNEERICIHANIHDTLEPVAFHCIFLNRSTPLVPWNSLQSMAIHNQVFLTLLDKLGFHLPSDTGKYFVRIPNFWTCDLLVLTANKLGPIDKCKASLKFSISEVCPDWEEKASPMDHCSRKVSASSVELLQDDGSQMSNLIPFRIQRTKQMNPLVQFTPLLLLKLSQVVIDPILSEDMEDGEDLVEETLCHSNENLHDGICIPTSEENSMCESPSVTSDLTRMYVSDEEDK